ncbi:hypothetical protein [Maliponia aquimaris]|uniref:Uncharacterized protein n=1 Tax=Maliponia aquimaris TaxID=1673631 RepID=A0A238K4S0_9RHOB|nr:hypothetical protein [Maliponia aquimaris]SMX37447.1 hypothetical protein MAA8898_01147 [Maliponia aquimaris]
MKLPNALNPNLLSPAERRAELCRLLALGLVRLRMRENAQLSAPDGDFPLHNSADRSGHATTAKRRTA